MVMNEFWIYFLLPIYRSWERALDYEIVKKRVQFPDVKKMENTDFSFFFFKKMKKIAPISWQDWHSKYCFLKRKLPVHRVSSYWLLHGKIINERKFCYC